MDLKNLFSGLNEKTKRKKKTMVSDFCRILYFHGCDEKFVLRGMDSVLCVCPPQLCMLSTGQRSDMAGPLKDKIVDCSQMSNSSTHLHERNMLPFTPCRILIYK